MSSASGVSVRDHTPSAVVERNPSAGVLRQLVGWLAEVSTLRVPHLIAAGIVAVTAAFLWRRLVDFPTQPLSINSADRGL